MSTDNAGKPLDEAERKRIWDDVAAEEAGGKGPTAGAETQAAANDTTQALASAAQTQAVDTTAQPAQTDAVPDKFAGIPQEVRDYMAGLQTQVEQLTTRMRSNEGSIGGLKSALQRQRDAAQATRETGAAAPTDTQIQQAQAGGSTAMAKLAEQYPEFAEQLGAVLKEELAVARAATQPQTQAEQPAAVNADEAIALARRDAYIEGKGFKGWQDQIKQPEFVGWFNRQPAEIQMLGHSANPDHAVRLLEIHREQATKPAAQRDLNAFAGVSEIHRSGSTGQRGTKSLEEMTPAEYWKHLSEQEKQTSQRG